MTNVWDSLAKSFPKVDRETCKQIVHSFMYMNDLEHDKEEQQVYWVLLYVMVHADKDHPWLWAAYPDVHAIYNTEQEAEIVRNDMGASKSRYWVKRVRFDRTRINEIKRALERI